MKTAPAKPDASSLSEPGRRLMEFLAAEDGMDIGVVPRDPLVEKLAVEDGMEIRAVAEHELNPSAKPSDASA